MNVALKLQSSMNRDESGLRQQEKQKRGYSPMCLALSGNRGKFLEVRFHTYWYTLIEMMHLSYVLVYTYSAVALHHVLVYADHAAAFE